MGNTKFRLSDMLPSAWFYKLKDMSKTRKHSSSSPKKKPTTSTFPPQRTTHLSQTRYSYYITTQQQPNREEKLYNSPMRHKASSDTHFPEPRRSSTRRSRRKAVYKPSPKKHGVYSSVSSGHHCSCRHASAPESPDYFGSSSSERNSTGTHEFHELIPSEFKSQSKFCSYNCRVSSSTCDTVIDMNKQDSTKKRHHGFDMISEVELPPILTRPMLKIDDNDKAIEFTKFRKSTISSTMKDTKGHRSPSVKSLKEERSSTSKTQKDQKTATPSMRNYSSSPTGIKLRGNSPRLASKKLQQSCGARKSVSKNRGISDSFAVVKSSLDPQRDFKDSMRDMILENNIKESKDLEDLLACYLSLNSREYHDLIVKAFEQIWFDMAHIKISDS